MRIAALVKQIPAFEAMELGEGGRLRRDGLPLEMSAYCRRAVSEACALAAEHGGVVTVLTLGPPTAADVLREAIAWGLARGVEVSGVLCSDGAFAGSDTLATARALAGALQREGPFDLVLCGRNSLDAETGQVGPELAALLDRPFLTGVREVAAVAAQRLRARCELDDGWLEAEVELPAVCSVAERLIEPCKVDAAGRAGVPVERLRTLTAGDLGPGPWGAAGSPTSVGSLRLLEAARARQVVPDAPVEHQVRDAVALLAERGALRRADRAEPSNRANAAAAAVPAGRAGGVAPTGGATDDRTVAVLVEPGRDRLTRELLGTAARLAAPAGEVIALGPALATSARPGAATLGSWGADRAVALDGDLTEEQVAAALRAWMAAGPHAPWAVLAPSTAWGREIASRLAAVTGSGLTGDAVDLVLDGDRLLAWKPAFGGQLVAAVHTASPCQMATVRDGALPVLVPRTGPPAVLERLDVPTGPARVHVLGRGRDDDLDVLAGASAIVAVGTGVEPSAYPELAPLLDVLGAELAATRKVTDRGWLPRARQVGITGRSVAPRLYVAIGVSGKFNHAIGFRGAGAVLAVNPDPEAPVFGHADVGIVAGWQEVVPLLVAELEARALDAVG